MIGLEFALWYLLVTGKKSYGRYRLSEQESAIVHALLALRRLDRVRYEGEVFVPLEDWKRTFATEASKHLSDDEN